MLVSTIEHMLKDIILRIPEELLKETFLSDDRYYNQSLDGIIKEKIIVDIVLRKCNLYAGKISRILLKYDWIEKVKSDTLFPYGGEFSYYRIPPEVREYKDIIYVLDAIYPYKAAYNSPVYEQSYHSLLTKANELYETTFNSGIIKPIPRLKDGNIVWLDPPIPYHEDWVLVCMLAFDSNFTNLSPGVIQSLCELAVLATQMYIYNTLKIKVDMAYIHGGQELGAFKEILESYSDSHDKFTEAIMKFRGDVTFDEDSALALINLMIPS